MENERKATHYEWEGRMREKLICPICQEYFNTTVLLRPCSHNFCSLCIRRHLSSTTECPSCRQTATMADIQVNRIMDEIVADFKNIPIVPSQQDQQKEMINLHSPAKNKDKEGQVECPVCSTLHSIESINSHLDQCLSPKKEAQPLLIKPSRKRMTKPVYNLLKDADLKRILTDLQLPVTGNRDSLIRRHSEFVNLYNADCDAFIPRSMDQLRSELRRLEKTWVSSPVATSSHINEDDFVESARQYRKANALLFNELVESIRKRRRIQSNNEQINM